MANWEYDQATGRLRGQDGQLVATGYSGFGVGKNNPNLDHVPDIGPIPRGRYIAGAASDSLKLGPIAVPLGACDGTETYGRSGFFMHGDSIQHPGQASHGCIIMPPWVRSRIEEGDCIFVTASAPESVPLPEEA